MPPCPHELEARPKIRMGWGSVVIGLTDSFADFMDLHASSWASWLNLPFCLSRRCSRLLLLLLDCYRATTFVLSLRPTWAGRAATRKRTSGQLGRPYPACHVPGPAPARTITNYGKSIPPRHTPTTNLRNRARHGHDYGTSQPRRQRC